MRFLKNKKIIAGFAVLICLCLVAAIGQVRRNDKLSSPAISRDDSSKVDDKESGTDNTQAENEDEKSHTDEMNESADDEKSIEESNEESNEEPGEDSKDTKEDEKIKGKKDTTPPEILGVTNIEANLGSIVLYKKNILVRDDSGENIGVEVDVSAVNPNAAGTYPIKYIARDSAGNEAVAEATITLKYKEYTQEEVFAMADKILAEIITPGMNQEAKCLAIYNYVTRNVRYYARFTDSNWIKAAFYGLEEKRGDCFVYASTTKALLTRAGIPNRDISKIPTRESHYWNLVDVGNGWVHLDTTPNLERKVKIFLWNDEKLMEYSKGNQNSHNYDRSVYTNIS